MVSFLQTTSQRRILPGYGAEKTESLYFLDRFRPWTFGRAIHHFLAWLNHPSITFRRHSLQHTGFRRGNSSFEVRVGSVLGKEGRWRNSGELAEEFLAQTSTLTKSEVNGSPRCAVRQENTVEDTNGRDSVGEVVQYYEEVPALNLVRITSRQAGATPPRKLAQTRERGAVAS